MKRLRFAAASAAVIGLAGCTHATAPNATRTGHGTGTLIAPVSCSQQYRTWNHGQGKGLMDALDRGVSTLVDADMNEVSTRLQALQTQQQLGVQALSIANASTQSILKLFQ